MDRGNRTEEIGEDLLPEKLCQDVLAGPCSGRIVGGTFDGMTPVEVTAQWERYKAEFGE